MTIEEARDYCGTTPTSGVAQFALLALEGLTPRSVVVEYGCGTLHLARVLLGYLEDPQTYFATDPNAWLIRAALADDPDIGLLPENTTYSDTFGTACPDGAADLVFAHSVLSHATEWQLAAFCHRARSLVAPRGRVVFSFREGPDSGDDAWVYPETSRFSWATMRRVMASAGLSWHPADHLRGFYVAACPDEVHDWVVAW